MSFTTPAEILSRCELALRKWAEENGAHLVIAQNAYEPLDQLFNGPNGLLLALHWGGDEPDGDAMPGGPLQVEHRIVLTVGHKLSLVASPGQALVQGVGGNPGLLDQASAAQILLLSLTFEDDTTERRLRYGGTKPVTFEGAPLAAYETTFALSAHGPEPIEYDPE